MYEHNVHKRNNTKNTVQTIQNTVNTSTHPKHPHITKPTYIHTHTLQNKLKQTVQDTHQTKIHVCVWVFGGVCINIYICMCVCVYTYIYEEV
jgi:hypothetical protein